MTSKQFLVSSSVSNKHKANKVVFFVSSMEMGGAERVASLLCNHWASHGRSVYLVPTFSGGGVSAFQIDKRVHWIPLSEQVKAVKWPTPSKVRRLIALRKLIRTIDPDVIVSFLTHVNVAVLLASIGTRIPVIVSERTYPPAMPPKLLTAVLRKYLYPRAATVVMQTERGLQWLNNYCRSASGTVIGNPVWLPLPRVPPVIAPTVFFSSSRRLIVSVGRLEIEKGYDKLIAAFAQISEQFVTWDLAILGEGKERKLFEELIAEKGLQSRVYMPGRVGNIAEWYERADIYALTSRFEGFPNALLEAMAHGVPAVSFDCETGPSTIVQDGVNGLLIDPKGGVESLASGLALLMKNDLKRASMAVAAKDVQHQFSVRSIAQEWNLLIDSCGKRTE